MADIDTHEDDGKPTIPEADAEEFAFDVRQLLALQTDVTAQILAFLEQGWSIDEVAAAGGVSTSFIRTVQVQLDNK